jgi:hypothetical protein
MRVGSVPHVHEKIDRRAAMCDTQHNRSAAHALIKMRYYFHISGTESDEEGDELPSDNAAHLLALKTAKELTASWENKPPTAIVVKDETGRLVTEVPLPPRKLL